MTLESLRNNIDALDDQLLDLLNQRMELVRRVGELKRSANTVIYRPEREKQILRPLRPTAVSLLKKPPDRNSCGTSASLACRYKSKPSLYFKTTQ